MFSLILEMEMFVELKGRSAQSLKVLLYMNNFFFNLIVPLHSSTLFKTQPVSRSVWRSDDHQQYHQHNQWRTQYHYLPHALYYSSSSTAQYVLVVFCTASKKDNKIDLFF